MNAFISVLACSPGSVPKAGHLSRARIARQRDGGVGTAVALNRLIFKPTEVDRNGTVVLPQEDYRSAHVREVLRLPREGGTIRGGVADQYLVNDVPVSIEGDRGVSFHLASGVQQELPEAPHISLILAVPRPKVLARLLPQIVAIGVRNIVLCNAYKVRNQNRGNNLHYCRYF